MRSSPWARSGAAARCSSAAMDACCSAVCTSCVPTSIPRSIACSVRAFLSRTYGAIAAGAASRASCRLARLRIEARIAREPERVLRPHGDEKRALEDRMATQLARDLKTVEPRQRDLQEDDVRHELARRLQGERALVGEIHFMAEALAQRAERIGCIDAFVRD